MDLFMKCHLKLHIDIDADIDQGCLPSIPNPPPGGATPGICLSVEIYGGKWLWG